MIVEFQVYVTLYTFPQSGNGQRYGGLHARISSTKVFKSKSNTILTNCTLLAYNRTIKNRICKRYFHNKCNVRNT